MGNYLVLGLSLALQAYGAAVILRLVRRLQSRTLAWVVGIAALLLVTRRVALFWQPPALSSSPIWVLHELLELAASLLVVAGIAWATPHIIATKGSRKELQQSRDETQAVLDSIPDALLSIDGQGKVVDYRAPRLAASPFERPLPGQHVQELFPSAAHGQLQRALQQALLNEEPQTIEYTRPSAGGARHLEARVTAAGADRLLIVVRDVTNRETDRQALRTQAERQERLLATARQLAGSLDVHEVLARIAAEAHSLLHAHGSTIYLLAADGQTMFPVVAIDPNYEAEVMASSIRVDSSFTGLAVRAKSGLIFNDAAHNSAGHQIPGTPVEQEERIIAVPFVAEDRVLGAICVDRIGTIFTSEDLSLAEAFAAYATAALKNAAMYQELQKEMQERQAAEEALRAEKTYFQQLFDNSPEAIAIVDTDSRPLRVNNAFTALFGYRQPDIEGVSLDDALVPSELREEARAATRQTLERRVLSFESVRLRRDGAPVQVSILATPVEFEHIQASYVIYRDITERRRTETALDLERLYFEQLFTNTPEAIVLMEDGARIVRVNREYTRLFGYTSEESVGGTIMTLLVPEDRRAEAQVVRERVYRGETVMLETVRRRKDGTMIDVSLIATPIRLPDGTLAHYSIYRDVTSRKRAEAARRESEERFRIMFDGAHDLMAILDDQMQILWANRSWQGVFGFAGPSQQSAAMGAIAEVRARTGRGERSFTNIECVQPLADGRVAHLEITMRPFRAAGRPFFYLIAHDITERKRALEVQERLERHERLAAIGQLAAGVAHDFNNLLTGIIGFAELLRHDPELPEKMREDVDSISQEGRRGAALIRQILDFSRTSLSAPRPLDLRVWLEELVRFWERTLPESVTIRAELAATEATVVADPMQLHRALTNLALNASDAMPNGGPLTIRLSTLCIPTPDPAPIPELPPGRWASIAISDAGQGMSPEVIAHLYEPFFTTKPLGRGTGLGLAQVYGIVRQHEGFVGVQTAVGQGSCFTIYLPAAPDASHSAAASGAETIERGDGETILLVEDEPVVLEATLQLLAALGYNVLTARDGREALTVFDQHRAQIDLVISDWVMPSMGAAELCALLRERDPAVRVVISTGYPLGEQDIVAQGLAGWVQKPFHMQDLSQTVRQALSGR